jgi:ATP-binding cassette, subfamily B (MDR/TAP), member 1
MEKAESLGGTRMESDFEADTNSNAADQETDLVKRPGWRSLFNFTTRIHLVPLALAIIFSVASGIIIPVLAILLGKLFGLFTEFGADKISGSELVKKVSIYGIALVGLGSASGLLNAGYFMVWLIFGELQAKSVRDRLFDGMLEKDMEWYDMRKNGVDTLISRLQA